MSDPSEVPDTAESLAEIMRRIEMQPWEVTTAPVGAGVCVTPAKGMIGVEWGRYPRTAWGLRRAIRRCQRWCDRQNAKAARGRALAERAEGSTT